jgi:adenylate cyclase
MEDNAATHSSKARFTLRFTFVSAICGLTLLTGLVMSIVTSNIVGRFIREEFRNRLADSVNIAASQINAGLLQNLHTRSDEQSPAYTTLQTQLREIRDRGTDIRYVYTMRLQQDGQIAFIVDAEEDPAKVSHAGDVYPESTPTLLQALQAPRGTKRAYVEQNFGSDAWGTWLSAYAPLYASDGTPEGIVGMDISADSVLAHERQYQFIVWLVCIGATVAVLPIGLAIAQRIRRPLATLETEMVKVKAFELDSKETIPSNIIEIKNMIDQLDNMKSGLRSFRKYLPADLVRQLLGLGVEARLGGAKEMLTIFMSDVTGFTTISEQLPPDALIHYLGEYLNGMTNALLTNQATVSQYLGDGILAFWGAPQPMQDHAVKACQAALDCQSAVGELNRKWQAEGTGIVFNTRIGINTGEAIVGNIGSDEHMSYSVIGDNVNLASRLEAANKIYGTSILISEQTRCLVENRFITRLLDKVVVLGKHIPIPIYELLDTELPAERLQLVDDYRRAFDLYTSRRFGAAASLLEQILGRSSDRPAQLLLERCRAYLATPPAADWNGSFVLQSK